MLTLLDKIDRGDEIYHFKTNFPAIVVHKLREQIVIVVDRVSGMVEPLHVKQEEPSQDL